MSNRYAIRNGAVVKTRDANVIGMALEEIRDRHGSLIPRRVWEDSADPSAPLHPEFEWNDTEAAEQYRDTQARSLIRAVRVVNDEGRSMPAYLHVQVETTSCYQPTGLVLSDPELRTQAMAEARRYLSAARNRLEDIEGVMDVLKPVDAAIGVLDERMTQKRKGPRKR